MRGCKLMHFSLVIAARAHVGNHQIWPGAFGICPHTAPDTTVITAMLPAIHSVPRITDWSTRVLTLQAPADTIGTRAPEDEGDTLAHRPEDGLGGITAKSRLLASYSQALRRLPPALVLNILDAVDPCLELAIERMHEIYTEMFWASPAAFKYGQACLALAKRGLKSGRITVYFGPGGVGKSTYTRHLGALVGDPNHCTFDPNIFCCRERLVRRVPKLAGRWLCNGWNRPAYSMPPLRSDLLKGFCDSMRLEGRLMFDTKSSRFDITGWKRFDVNKPFTISNAGTNGGFGPILRRFDVVQLHDPCSRGLPQGADDLDQDMRGSSSWIPNVKHFIVTGPAVAAGCKIQAEFENDHSGDDCMGIIGDYRAEGGDRGVTERFMRACCGVNEADHPALDLRNAGPAPAPAGRLLGRERR